jgi:hypothetical protein
VAFPQLFWYCVRPREVKFGGLARAVGKGLGGAFSFAWPNASCGKQAQRKAIQAAAEEEPRLAAENESLIALQDRCQKHLGKEADGGGAEVRPGTASVQQAPHDVSQSGEDADVTRLPSYCGTLDVRSLNNKNYDTPS